MEDQLGRRYRTHKRGQNLIQHFYKEDSLGKVRHRWWQNIDTYIKQMKCEAVDWIHQSLYRGRWCAIVSTGNEPLGAVKGAEFHDCLSCWKPRKESTPWKVQKVYPFCVRHT
jgi:hypothetical protein